ncbi:hypothetical protein OG455_29685 [Kitasatospora sp. NBC_01287]|uniref:hypothetical protein n=1 Tax=Kitasatospora sp. NBC_01287 TaxID=2903573 RepID=UPI002257CC48|nr:hypothetical protein [Kitasatospora sp. NBC_01287]MCX4749636.1 hypothetical protein [Kitasatospora sp. NBC_01287]
MVLSVLSVLLGVWWIRPWSVPVSRAALVVSDEGNATLHSRIWQQHLTRMTAIMAGERRDFVALPCRLTQRACAAVQCNELKVNAMRETPRTVQEAAMPRCRDAVMP